MHALWTVLYGASFAINTWATSSHVCAELAASITSESAVFYPGSERYAQDIAHNSMRLNQNATCAVEPGTAADLGRVLSALGRARAPFAVKAGGHAINPGFSSTTGVQVALARFNATVYRPGAGTVRVGAGQLWRDVYAALAPHNVTVVGGRNGGVGVGGLLLGGGYSWKTNQYGLSVDSIVSYELVLPSGRVLNVTGASHPDLFFALKGGGNNFGVVTNFEMKAFPQGAVWGGSRTFTEDKLDALITAGGNYYANMHDPKAGLLMIFLPSTTGQAGMMGSIQMFYDAPEPPAGIFDELLAIPAVAGTVSTQTYAAFAQSDAPLPRVIYESAPLVNYTAPMLRTMADEANRTAALLVGPANVSAMGYVAEFFLPSILSHALPGGGGGGGARFPPSAYPARRDTALLPSNLFVIWEDARADALVRDTLRTAAARLREHAVALGQAAADPTSALASKYPNYALGGTRAVELWGPHNLALLGRIRAEYDPDSIMGLTGGWKI